MAKLDDLFNKKKEIAPILDLSKAIVNSKEDFRKLFDKVPEFKIRPERVRTEEIKIRDKDFTFKMNKKETRALNQPYTMLDPIPVDMRSLKLDDLVSVPIEWKMLTNIRPKTKLEEEYFTRLVELGKSEIKTINREKREAMMTTIIRKTKNKAGIIETRAISCNECGDEFCTGKYCGNFSYDCYNRVTVPTTSTTGGPSTSLATAAALSSKSNGAIKARKSFRSRKKKKISKSKSSRSKSPKKSKTKSSRSKSEGRKPTNSRKSRHISGSKSE